MTTRWLFLAVMAGLAGCGGGGEGGENAPEASSGNPGPPPDPPAVTGLELPEKFSVISATEAGAGAGGAKPGALAAKGFAATLVALKAFDDADSDYSTDETHTYVYDRSMESLSVINEIVCYIGQTGAAQMVNRGPYIALVNESRCRQDQQANAGAQTGESSAGTAATFERWVVESMRADSASPQIVHVWVPDPEGEGLGEQSILVEITIEEGVSDARPFGSFTLSFRGVMSGADLGFGDGEIETMRGTLATVDNSDGDPQFTFISVGGLALPSAPPMDFGYENAASVRLDDADGTSGLALTSSHDTWNGNGHGGQAGERRESFAIAYNADRFLSHRDDDGDTVAEDQTCRARDAFEEHVWRYNLYHREDGTFRGRAVEGGERVELNSGFPFSYASGDGGLDEAYGWLGYHGVWTESGETPPDGQTIHRFDYDSDETVDYTLHVAPGRLIRRVAHQESLSAFTGDTFQFWGPHPDLGTQGQWLVAVAENLDFEIVSLVQWGENGMVLAETVDHDGNPATPPVPVAATFVLDPNEMLWMWSEALGGNVVYVHDQSAAPASRMIRFFAQEFVTASDLTLFPSGVMEIALYCYDRCLKGGLTQADVDAATGPWDLFHPYTGTAHRYTLAVEDGKVVLIDDANDAPLSMTDVSLASIRQEWGIGTGEMLTERLADESRPWTVNDEPTSYRWETGPNAWNLMVTATGPGGQSVVFDRPLHLPYVHSTANDANGASEYDGKRFLVEYGGPGRLHGFPWINDGSERWYAAVTLKDGVVLADDDNSFVVKGLEKEQSMREVDLAECSMLDAAAAYTDSGLTLPESEDIADVAITLADRPEVDGEAPAVIEGIVQLE